MGHLRAQQRRHDLPGYRRQHRHGAFAGDPPAIADTALVQVMDGHRDWENGAMLGAIPPGGSQTVEIPVYYLQTDPKHMTFGAPHPFRAVADPGNRVTELNEGNNQSAVINADAPKSCK